MSMCCEFEIGLDGGKSTEGVGLLGLKRFLRKFASLMRL